MAELNAPRARRLLEAVAAWLHFEKMCKKEPLFSEHYLSYPVGQFLNARFYDRVQAEFVHPVLGPAVKGPGAKPKVDFVVLDPKPATGIRIAIETKWVSGSPTLARDIVRDLIRLELLANKGAECLFVLAGRNRDLKKLFAQATLCPSPGHKGSKSLLPTNEERSEERVVRIENPSKYRQQFIGRARKCFSVPIGSTVIVKKLKPLPQERSGDYRVLGWLIESDARRTEFSP